MTLNAPAQAATQSVTMKDNFFDQATKTVARGDLVKWTHGGASFSQHTATADTPLTYFGSPSLNKGQTYTTPKPLAAGTYPYHCSFHGTMKGKLVVPVGLTKAGNVVTVALNTAAAPTGFKYVVQQKVGTAFKTIATVTTATHKVTLAKGTYQFRAAVQKGTTVPKTTNFSPVAQITV